MYKVQSIRQVRLVLSILILFRIVPSASLLQQIKCASSITLRKQITHCDGYSRKHVHLHDSSGFIDGPPVETKPDYESIHGPLGKAADDLFLSIFRTKMAEKVGVDSTLPKNDYNGVIELSRAMNSRYSDRTEVQLIAQNVLRSLFPSWLPGAFAWMFAKPFPEFSSRMNAWATLMGGTWLMGECELNDCEVDGGGIGENQGLLVKRCRFLEESSCASVCVNSCKIPTQRFFKEDMGLPLTMTPDYETGECQFSFGLTPTEETEFEAKNTPCLMSCPSAGKLRSWHDGKVTESEKPRCTQMEN